MKKQACIIFSKKCDGNVVLGKVRDRMYDPSVCVYHLELDGTEICVMFDRITGFCEGINEHGIGIVNSALMVLQDEAEGMADGDREPERSPDGIKIIKALTKKTVPEALRALIAYKPRKFQRGLKGHTLISDGKEIYALENTRIHTPKVLRLKPHEVNTRTNHGIYYPGAGYTKGDDYISSIVRQWEAKKQLERVQRAEDLMPALTQSIEKTDGSMNPVRFTDKMRTTSQMVVDPAKGEMLLYLVPEHSKFEGVRNLLPGGRKPKMKVRVFKYPSKDKLKDPYVTVPDEMETASARKSLRRQIMAQRVAARYKSKKKVKTKDGDEMTVYEYSDRQVADRNRKKAERIEHLRKSMAKLRTKVRKDVQSKNERTRDLALAVGLMDETYERVGNDRSAKEGHFGVTTWRVKHVRFNKGGVTITYVGKSGVDQKKRITNARIVGALKRACKDKGKEDCVLSVSASDVNAYLEPFGISAKDIRGFHANEEMKAQLRKVRKGKLPKDDKERKAKLKEEFKQALELTADRVGHKASTLKGQYLVPGLEDDYMKDGTVNEKHTKTGTKSDAEKEDEAVEKMLRKEPKKKPPRYDLRDNRTLDEGEDENLGGGDKGDRDLSMKWNKVGHRVAFRWLAIPTKPSTVKLAYQHLIAEAQTQAPPSAGGAGAGQEAPKFEEWVKDKRWPSKAENAPPGAEVGFEGLKKQDPEAAKKVREEYRRQFPSADDDKGDKKDKGADEPKQRTLEDIDADLESARNDVDELEDAIEELQDQITEHKRNIEKLKAKRKQPKVDPEARKKKIQERIDEEKAKMRETVSKMKPLGKEIDKLEDRQEELTDEVKGQKKVIKDSKGILKQIGEDHPQAEQVKSAISEARQKIREVEGELDDVKEDLKAKKADYKDLRAAGKESAKTVKFLEGKLEEPEETDTQDPKENLKEERRKLEEAEEDLAEKKEDLKVKQERVDDLKLERKDPGGAKKQQAEKRKKERQKRVDEAIKKTTKSMQSILGKGSGLPRGFKDKIADQINEFSEDEMEQFALGFASTLKELVKQDPTSEDAISTANAMAKSGYSTQGLTSPEDLAERMAEVAYTRNVVANPMITGGTPVGQTDMDSQTYSARALDGFNQFKNLSGILRREAGARIVEELRGLDPETDRATELKGILAGINMAQIADTGESLPGQQQPSKGSAALIRKMVEMGHAETMLKPSEDTFSEVGRQAMLNALNNMTDEEVVEFIVGEDPKHPFARLRKVMLETGPAGSEFKQLIKSFLINDWMADIWGDRAVRDVMEAAGAPEWDDPEKRAQVLEEAKANGGPGRQKALDAMVRIDEAKKRGERPNPEDETLVNQMFGESGGGLMEGVKGLLTTLTDKFKKFVISPATAVLKNFAETGDRSVLETETLPHVDENSPSPRTKEEREKARAQAPKPGGPRETEPQYTPEQVQRARTRLKAMRRKLESQRDRVTPDQREKFDKQLKRIEGRLSDLESGKPGDLSDMGESPEDKDHKPGEVWRTDQGNWRAKNKKGVPKSFKDKAKAEQYAGRKPSNELDEGDPEGFSADFNIPVEERGPTRFASEKVAELWLAQVRRIHPDDPNRPRIVIEAA